jgi:hypothetical protein
MILRLNGFPFHLLPLLWVPTVSLVAVWVTVIVEVIILLYSRAYARRWNKGSSASVLSLGLLNVGSASPDFRPDFRWNKDGSSQLGPMITSRVGVSELTSRLEDSIATWAET